jgi:hypothetical protein
MNLQWTGAEAAPASARAAIAARIRATGRPRDDLDRAVDRMLADARGKCGVARGGRWTRDVAPAMPGRQTRGIESYGPGRSATHADLRHRRPVRAA